MSPPLPAQHGRHPGPSPLPEGPQPSPSHGAATALPNPLAYVTLPRPTGPGLPGTYNPCQLFQQAQRSLLNPSATGFNAAAPLYSYIMPPDVGLALYGTALAGSLARVQRSWAQSTLAARSRIQQEFSSWMASLPPIFGKNWYTAEPMDILVFMESVWVLNHAGTELPSGQGRVVAPSSLSGAISHLSTSFQLIGRSADWDTFGLMWPSKSNPASSQLLRCYKRGYAKDMKGLGYQPCSAYPLAESTYHQLLDGLQQLAAQQQPFPRAITLRDGCAISAMWETALRGHDAGILRLSSIRAANGSTVLPFTEAPAAGEYLVVPWSTKPNQTDACEPIRIQYPTEPDQQQRSFLWWLWQLQQASSALQQPLTDFLFRPTVEGTVFAERPLTSAAIHERFVCHLRRFGLYTGQSPHGVRRGTMQNELQAGGSFSSVQERAQIKTDRIVRLYINPVAHLRGGKGQKRLRGDAEGSSSSSDED